MDCSYVSKRLKVEDAVPGKIYFACRSEEVFFALAIVAPFNGDPPSLVMLSKRSATDYGILPIFRGEIFEHGAALEEGPECRVVPSLDIEKRNSGTNTLPPAGALVCAGSDSWIIAQSDSQKQAVHLKTGKTDVKPPISSWWFSEWAVKAKDFSGEWVDLCIIRT